MNNIDVRVSRICTETDDVRTLEFEAVRGERLPLYAPGSHIDVYLPSGLVRQYSLCDRNGDGTRYTIAVKLEPESRGGSAYLHEQVHEGDVLRLGTPRNNFRLHQSADHHVLMAAGIGITPILSMAYQLAAEGLSFEIHYFTRSHSQTPFRTALSEPDFHGKVDFYHGLAPDAVQLKLRGILQKRQKGAHLYLCGPRPFMVAIQTIAHGEWPAETVHLENFSAPKRPSEMPGESFRVRLARSGGEYIVPARESIAATLVRNGVNVSLSCELGICGSCLTRVLEGQPEHHDSYLSDAEKQAGDKMMICVSRASTEALVLDL